MLSFTLKNKPAEMWRTQPLRIWNSLLHNRYIAPPKTPEKIGIEKDWKKIADDY